MFVPRGRRSRRFKKFLLGALKNSFIIIMTNKYKPLNYFGSKIRYLWAKHTLNITFYLDLRNTPFQPLLSQRLKHYEALLMPAWVLTEKRRTN